MTKVGEEIDELLRNSGHTRRELCSATGIEYNCLSRMICGRKTPGAKMLRAIEKFVGVEENYLDAFINKIERPNRTAAYIPSKREEEILQAWHRGDRTPEEISEITGYSLSIISRYIPMGEERENRNAWKR